MGIHDGHRARKKEQFIQTGLDSFADHEALELLLFYAIPRRDTNPTAHLLLQKFGSLEGVFSASVEELKSVEGVGESAAILLSMMHGLFRRSARSTTKEKILNSVESCGRYFLDLLRHERQGEGHLIICSGEAFFQRAKSAGECLSPCPSRVLVLEIISSRFLPDKTP